MEERKTTPLSKDFGASQETPRKAKVRKLSLSAVKAAVRTVYLDAIWDTNHLRKPVEEALLAGLEVIKGGSVTKENAFNYERNFAGDIYDDGKNPSFIQTVPYSITTTTGDKIMTEAVSDPGAGPSTSQPNKWNESISFEPVDGRKKAFANPRDADIIAILEKVALHAHASGQIVLEDAPKQSRALRPSR
jgi:hypothetical protein